MRLCRGRHCHGCRSTESLCRFSGMLIVRDPAPLGAESLRASREHAYSFLRVFLKTPIFTAVGTHKNTLLEKTRFFKNCFWGTCVWEKHSDTSFWCLLSWKIYILWSICTWYFLLSRCFRRKWISAQILLAKISMKRRIQLPKSDFWTKMSMLKNYYISVSRDFSVCCKWSKS